VNILLANKKMPRFRRASFLDHGNRPVLHFRTRTAHFAVLAMGYGLEKRRKADQDVNEVGPQGLGAKNNANQIPPKGKKKPI
jgi:hypothetical protein